MMLGTSRRGYVSTAGGQLHYRESGSGSPVLLLHQTASSSVMYERCMPILAEQHHAIAMDTPGFGMSDPPPDRPRDCAFYIQTVLGLLDALEISRASLVGFHTGATIALEVAARHPDRVTALALAGLCAIGNDAEEKRWYQEIVEPYEIDGDGRFLDRHVTFVREMTRDAEAFVDELTARLQAGPQYWWAYEAVLASRHFDRLGEVECPVLFISPRDDVLTAETRAAHRDLEGSAFVEIPGDIGAVTEFPREFTEVVMDFLREAAGS